MTTVAVLHACSCGARPGELHEGGCDREQCCLCGLQAITCGCVYEVNGMDRASLAETHPEIYGSGPTAAMTAALEAEEAKWGGRLPHAVRSSNAAVCHELGLWCRWDGRSFVPCSKDTPGALEDLNRLLTEGRWDRARRRFVVDGH